MRTPRCTPCARQAHQLHTLCTRCLAQLASTCLTHTHTHTYTHIPACLQLVGMRLSERFTLYVHEDANSKGALAVTRRAAAEAGKGRVAEVISSVARSGTGHAFERGGLHKISEHFRAALEAMLSPPPAGRAHSHAILVEDDLLLSNPSPSPNPNSNPNPDPNLSPNPNQDDLLLSPDALLLFWSSAWLLREDPSLWCAAVPTPMSVLTPMLSMSSPFNPPLVTASPRCVSAWHDQGFPHTASDPQLLTRTDYFPGLGWMIEAETWAELKDRWPARPTTGWDHWFRLSTTSRGRECVVPRINRSRHANKKVTPNPNPSPSPNPSPNPNPNPNQGTNVLDNSPFERFSFETEGVRHACMRVHL